MYITRDLQVTKLYISQLMKILNMGDSINCERGEQREAFTGVQGAGPLAGVARGQRPLA